MVLANEMMLPVAVAGIRNNTLTQLARRDIVGVPGFRDRGLEKLRFK